MVGLALVSLIAILLRNADVYDYKISQWCPGVYEMNILKSKQANSAYLLYHSYLIVVFLKLLINFLNWYSD